ncbi:MAG TPA: hypothetical protein VK904_00370, partial [Miltoncostaeaceae bacterium]|nr:hypothetical protein [Miltoncostaeaceae bacterium]
PSGMRSWIRNRGAMIRVGLIVVAIAAGAFALNLFRFDAADSTGSAGRLSPRADDPPLRTVTTVRPGRATTTTPGDDRAGRTATTSDDRRSDDRGSDDRSDGRGSDDDSSGPGSGGDDGDDGGRGRGRRRGGDED